tara:strand:+ start:123 stop:380 length:258 start_codon:yes stop_codon:yes gene_type:complete
MSDPKQYRSIKEAAAAALKVSKAHPKEYVTLNIWPFGGAYVTAATTFNVFTPSDSFGDYYWLNGKRKPFTAKQKIADQNATPTMA